ncbi:MAG: GPR endopeptidase [Clostridia bacterium]|nr:GPR endopeptidase [Clostridia bacterium]
MESRELNPDIQGISEQTEETEEYAVSRIKIETHEAASKLEKPIGLYVTLDAPALAQRPLPLFEEVSRALAEEITHMAGSLPERGTVLVVGLGNRAITPDSLGPRVAERIYVTRHINEYMPNALPRPVRSVCSVAPGVLGVTGVETMEVVRGVAEHIKPDLIIAIDALASRRAARISTTIQLTDTGISPGSGVGNTRKGLTPQVFGVPVIAIGVPMVVHAATISQEVISLIADKTGLHGDEEKLRGLAAEVINENLGPLVVTPKDIDTIVEDMSRVIADAINLALFRTDYEDVRMLIA